MLFGDTVYMPRRQRLMTIGTLSDVNHKTQLCECFVSVITNYYLIVSDTDIQTEK